MKPWILTADWQFDEQPRYSRLTPSGITTRLQDQIDCLRWAVERALAVDAEGIIVDGDIFDSRTDLNLSVIDMVCREFHAAAERGLKIVFIVGNHDSYLRSPVLNSLQMFRGYATVVDTPRVVGPFACLPWVDDPVVLAKWVDQLVGKAPFLVGHMLVDGSVHQSAVTVPLKTLQLDRWKKVFLGDVHDPDAFKHEKVHYIGAPMQLHFGDAGGFRGIVLLNPASATFTRIENKLSPRFHVISDVTTEGIRPNDFVRVKTDDIEIASAATAAVKGMAGWVESTHVDVADVKPRLDVHARDTHEEVLARYCAYRRIDDPELIALGVDILEEARKA